MDDPHPQWRRTLDAWGAGRVRRALAGEADLGGIDHTFARNWLLAHEIRHALFWARVRTAVLLLFAAASAVLAFDVIVDWLR